MRVRWLVTALAVGCTLLLAGPAAAVQAGHPDTAFSGDGRRTADVPGSPEDRAEAVLVQADGRIVLGGFTRPGGGDEDFGLVRLLGNGGTDTSFSGDGFRSVDVRGVGGEDRIWDLAQQADGKIVAVGHAANFTGTSVGFAVARFRANGTLDPSFSGDGKLVVTFPGFTEAWGYAVAIQDDGKILVGGEAVNPFPDFDWDMAVVRIKPNGTLDTTYGGGDARVLTNFSGHRDAIQDMVLQEDGKLVVAGWSNIHTGGNLRFAFARYNTTGGLDHSFAGDGRQTVDVIPSADNAYGVAVRSDGKIVAAGNAGFDIGMVRLTPDGLPDPTFGGDGSRVSAPAADDLFVRDFDLAPGDQLVVTGYPATNNEVFVARFDPSGVLDADFGRGGIVVTGFPEVEDSQADASAVQPNGRILIAGSAGSIGISDVAFAVARFLP